MITYLWNSLVHELTGGGKDAIIAWVAIGSVVVVTLLIIGVAVGVSAYFIW